MSVNGMKENLIKRNEHGKQGAAGTCWFWWGNTARKNFKWTREKLKWAKNRRSSGSDELSRGRRRPPPVIQLWDMYVADALLSSLDSVASLSLAGWSRDGCRRMQPAGSLESGSFWQLQEKAMTQIAGFPVFGSRDLRHCLHLGKILLSPLTLFGFSAAIPACWCRGIHFNCV